MEIEFGHVSCSCLNPPELKAQNPYCNFEMQSSLNLLAPFSEVNPETPKKKPFPRKSNTPEAISPNTVSCAVLYHSELCKTSHTKFMTKHTK
jgi:hypothetical protein